MFKFVQYQAESMMVDVFCRMHGLKKAGTQDWGAVEDAAVVLCDNLTRGIAKKKGRKWTEEAVRSMRRCVEQRCGMSWATDDPIEVLGPVKHRYRGVAPEVGTADMFALIAQHLSVLTLSRGLDNSTAGEILGGLVTGQMALDAA